MKSLPHLFSPWRWCALFFIFCQRSEAVDWTSIPLNSAPDTAAALATAVDSAGREHAVYKLVNGDDASIIYTLRTNQILAPSHLTVSLSSRVTHLSLDVGADYTVVIAAVLDNGNLIIMEKPANQSTFSQTHMSPSVALATSTGGISVIAAGNGVSTHSIAYTGADGSLKFRQKAAASWSGSTVNVTIGANTGLAPTLIETSGGYTPPNPRPFMIVSCDTVSRRVQASFYSTISGTWEAPQTIETLPESGFTRAGASSWKGRVGVSFETTSGSGSSLEHSVKYAEYNGTSWNVQAITGSDEIASLQFFNDRTCLRYDATGAPMIAYQRDAFLLVAVITTDQRFRRLVPGIGWELSTIQTFAAARALDFSLATDPAGDPIVLTATKPSSGTATVSFHRPENFPWACGVAHAPSGNTFAPALASSPDGAVHMVVGTATSGTAWIPRTYQPPGLFTYRENSHTFLPLPSSNTPHVANAIAPGADGTLHIVSLRIDSTASTTGDLLYYNVDGGTVTGPIAVNESGTTGGIAARKPIRLGCAADGTLYLAYTRAAGGLCLATLPRGADLSPGANPWNVVWIISSAVSGADLAVRPDGGTCLSYFDEGLRRILLLSNINLNTGNLLPSFLPNLLTTLTDDENDPLNTACAIDGSGLPAVAACVNAGTIKLYQRTGATVTRTYLTGKTTPSAIVDLNYHAGSRSFGIAVSSARDGGSLEYLQTVSGNPATVQNKGRFSLPAKARSSLGEDLATCLDSHGLPWTACGYFSSPSIGFFTDSVLLCRRADSLDADGDGIPLLLEQAFCLSPDVPDSISDLPQPYLNRDAATVRIGHSFRHPRVPMSPIVEVHGVQIGDISYTLESSGNLTAFGTPPSAVLPISTAAIGWLSDSVEITRHHLNFPPTLLSAHPLHFVRLGIHRKR